MPKKRQLVTSNNCFELGKVGLLRYSNEKHALDSSTYKTVGLMARSLSKALLDLLLSHA